VRLLLHPPAAPRHAEEPVRQGRRLPALLPARQLHHADRPPRRRGRPDRRPAPLAALRLRPRHRPRAPPRPPRAAEDAPGRPHGAPPPAGRGGDPHPRPDRPLPGVERRRPPRAHGPRAGRPPSRGGDDRGGAGRPDPPPGRAPGAALGDSRGGTGDRRRRPRLAGGAPAADRPPDRLRGRRAVPAGRRAAPPGGRLRGVRGGGGRHRSRPPVRGGVRARAPPAPGAAAPRPGGDGRDRRAVRPRAAPAARRGRARGPAGRRPRGPERLLRSRDHGRRPPDRAGRRRGAGRPRRRRPRPGPRGGAPRGPRRLPRRRGAPGAGGVPRGAGGAGGGDRGGAAGRAVPPAAEPGLTTDVPRLPTIAIVGRPNVGKSTLFNRLIGNRKAIVRDVAGVTRDRLRGTCRFGAWRAAVVDTGGLDPGAAEPLVAQVRAQVLAAIAEADALVFVLDAREGVTALDEEVARMLRRVAKPVLVAANKVETAAQ